MNRSQIIPSLINGIICGCMMVLLILLRKQVDMPQPVLFVLQLILMASSVVYTLKQYRTKNESSSDKIALNLGHLTFTVAAVTVLTFRYFNGWFSNQSFSMIILEIAAIVFLGRILTYFTLSILKK